MLVTHDLDEAAALADRMMRAPPRPDPAARPAVRRAARGRSRSRSRASSTTAISSPGEIVAHEAGCTRLAWLDYVLEAPLAGGFAAGERGQLGDPARALHPAPARPAVARRARESGRGRDRRVPPVRRERRRHAPRGRPPGRRAAFLGPDARGGPQRPEGGCGGGVSLLKEGIHLMPHDRVDPAARAR